MALTFEEKLDPHSVLQLLLRGIGYYLASWHDLDETFGGLFGTVDPQAFNMRSVGSSSPVIEYVIRPHLQALCTLAAFLYRNETALLEPLVTKDRLVEIIRKGIAWACDTHLTGDRDVATFLERRRWGENWRSSLWAALLGLSCRLAREALTPELVEKVKRVLAHEADRFIGVLPPSGCDVDTKLEENAFDVLCMSWAINLCDGHPSMERWKRTCGVWALNIASSQNDRADHAEYLEKSVSHFATTQTLFPDLTAENHGFFHPDILGYGMWVVLVHGSLRAPRQAGPRILPAQEPPADLRPAAPVLPAHRHDLRAGRTGHSLFHAPAVFARMGAVEQRPPRIFHYRQTAFVDERHARAPRPARRALGPGVYARA